MTQIDFNIKRGQVSRLLLYADSFKLPRELSHPLLKKMVNIAKCSGEEYACTYMKAIKLDFIRIKAGLDPCSTWVKKTGPYKGLITWSKENHKRWSKVICLLQAYTIYYSPKPTQKQIEKFVSGVESENLLIPQTLTNGVILAGSILFNKTLLRDPRPHYLNIPNENKRSPHPNGRTYAEGDNHLESINYVLKTDFGRKIQSKYGKYWDSVKKGIEIVNPFKGIYHSPHSLKAWSNLSIYPDSVGKIGLIQEAGYKLRAVANPGRIYQSLLKPLGDDLFEKIKSLPWDCTFHQSKADYYIHESLKKNDQVYSVDLTGATDYFPLDLQVSLLKSLYYNPDHVDMFYDISRGPWIFRDKTIKWTKGQPLGLYPSFASFALTHGVMLFLLNGLTHDNKFFILGDDVVILDALLYKTYITTLETIGCPISESKTLSSSIIVEFAGKIFTSYSKLDQLKWRNPSDDNFLDLVRNIGLSVLPCLKPLQQKIVKVLSQVPDFLGGLGFNPKGLSLTDRIAFGYEVMKEKQGAKYLMDFNRIFNKMNYYSSERYPSYDQFCITDNTDFDKKSKEMISKHLPLLIYHYKVLGGNLFDVDEDLRLRIECVTTRKTQLSNLLYLVQ